MEAKYQFGAIKRQYNGEYRTYTIRAKAQIDGLEQKKRELMAEMGFVELNKIGAYF